MLLCILLQEREEIAQRKSLGEIGLDDILQSKPEPLQLSTPGSSAPNTAPQDSAPPTDGVNQQDLMSQTDDAKVSMNYHLINITLINFSVGWRVCH